MDMRDRPPGDRSRRSCSRAPRPSDCPGSAQNSTQKKAMDFLEDESHSSVASFPGSLDESSFISDTDCCTDASTSADSTSESSMSLDTDHSTSSATLSCILYSEQSQNKASQTLPHRQQTVQVMTQNSSTSADVPGGEDEPYKLTALYKSLIESKTPLYPGSEVTILDSYILLYEYALRLKEAFSELLQLVSVHLPSSVNSAKSVYLLQKYFEKHFSGC